MAASTGASLIQLPRSGTTAELEVFSIAASLAWVVDGGDEGVGIADLVVADADVLVDAADGPVGLVAAREESQHGSGGDEDGPWNSSMAIGREVWIV